MSKKELTSGRESQAWQANRFTAAEQQNIINLYNRGELASAIAKLFDRTPASMATYIWQLKKKGLITDRARQNRVEEEVFE